MKVYPISSPDVLERAADIVKWPGDRIKIMNYVALWRRTKAREPEHIFPTVTLEVGRQAQLVRTMDGRKTPMANLYTAGTKQFITDEGLVET